MNDAPQTEDEKDEVIRVCMKKSMGEALTPSATRQCSECNEDVWYDESQVGPPHPKTGKPVKEDLILCAECFIVKMVTEGEEPQWLLPEGESNE